MPADDSLKRLGGGRWETRDGRFAIEPQSGTWVIVDNSQTDELGLPLVRGPFATLTAAKAAIESARRSGPVESPLAERMREAAEAGADRPKPESESETKPSAAGRSRKAPKPEPPLEPKWIRDLDPAERRRAHALIDRLGKLGIPDPEAIARVDIAGDRPAVARVALERGLRRAMAPAVDPADAVRAAVKLIMSGKDRELEVRWRLIDDRGRRLDELDLSD